MENITVKQLVELGVVINNAKFFVMEPKENIKKEINGIITLDGYLIHKCACECKIKQSTPTKFLNALSRYHPQINSSNSWKKIIVLGATSLYRMKQHYFDELLMKNLLLSQYVRAVSFNNSYFLIETTTTDPTKVDELSKKIINVLTGNSKVKNNRKTLIFTTASEYTNKATTF